MSKSRLIHEFDKLQAFQTDDGTTFQFASGLGSTLARFNLKKGTRTLPKSHVYEQFTYVVKGSLYYTVGNQTIFARKGDFVHVPSGSVHCARVLENTVLLDFFSPAWPSLPESLGARKRRFKRAR